MIEPVRAILSLGSNLGDREGTLGAAVESIAGIDGVHLEKVSGIVETPAVKPHGVDVAAPAYLNLIVAVTTASSPEELLAALSEIEQDHGRVREERWGDRTLDIDIVTMGDLVQASPTVILPHPRSSERAFVLVPWLEIEPDASLPGIGSVALLPAAHEDVSRYETEADS